MDVVISSIDSLPGWSSWRASLASVESQCATEAVFKIFPTISIYKSGARHFVICLKKKKYFV